MINILNIKRKNYFRFLAFMLFLVIFLPVVYISLPPIIGSCTFFWSPIWLFSVFILYPKVRYQKVILYILLYNIVLVILLNTLWVEVRLWDKNLVKQEIYTFIVSISVIQYFLIARDYKGLALLVKFTLIFIGITAIMTINSSMIEPMYARYLTGGRFSEQEFLYFRKLGGAGYGYALSFVCLFPIMIYYYKNNSISIFSKKTILLYGALCFYAIIRTQIFANIMVAVVVILLSTLGTKKIKKSILIITIVLIIALIIPVTFYSNGLIYMSSLFDQNSETYKKLNDMAYFLVIPYSPGEAETRIARYPLLFDAFSKSPIFGYYVTHNRVSIGAGGHLYIMNKLAVYGLLGFLLFILIHYFYLRSIFFYFNKEYSFYFALSLGSVIALGLMKNLVGREFWFTYFVLLPGLYYLPLLKKNRLVNNDELVKSQIIDISGDF